MWPAGSTAARSFSDRPKTFGACSLPAGAREALFSSSPTVSTSIRCGDDPAPVPPTSCVSGSSTLVTLLPRLAVVPVVADDAAHRRRGAAHHRRVADGGDGGVVLEEGVGEVRAVGQQAIEARVVFGAEPREVVVAELIDGDEQHQLDWPVATRRRGVRRRGAGRSRREDDQQQGDGDKSERAHDMSAQLATIAAASLPGRRDQQPMDPWTHGPMRPMDLQTHRPTDPL